MVPVTQQGIWASGRRTEPDTAPRQTGRQRKKTSGAAFTAALLSVFLLLAAQSFFVGTSYAKEDAALSDSGILYPGGYDVNTVGNIQGKIGRVYLPDSGPVRIELLANKETYIILASPAWYWKDMKAVIPEGTEVTVRGSKSMGKDGMLYIVAQEIMMTASKKTLVFRSESGEPLWRGGSQMGSSGSRGGGFGSPSGGRIGGGSSGMGRGRR